jgi:hypothetical protein
MTRAVIFGAACAAAVGLLLAGCSDSSGEPEPTGSPTFSVPVSTEPAATATPNQTEYVATMRQQGFDEAESVLVGWGQATCGLLGQFTVQEAQQRMEGGAIPGRSGQGSQRPGGARRLIDLLVSAVLLGGTARRRRGSRRVDRANPVVRAAAPGPAVARIEWHRRSVRHGST